MPNLLAMSFEDQLGPSFDLLCLKTGHKLPDGWGLGFYPEGEPSASVLKEPVPAEGSIRSGLVKEWQHLASSLFVVHVRAATWGSPSDANTQPFLRSWGGRDWLFGHAGSLRQRLQVPPGSLFEPVGSTDTEEIFCELLNRFARHHWESLGDADLTTVQAWLDDLNTLGTLTVMLTDGRDLLVYGDRADGQVPYLWKVISPEPCPVFGDADLQIDLAKRSDKSCQGVVISSNVLEPTPEGRSWQPLLPGQLIVIRAGAVRLDLAPRAASAPLTTTPGRGSLLPPGRQLPTASPARHLSITHRTVYRYDYPVKRSTHYLRLVPIHDRLQSVLSSELKLSVDGSSFDYKDVFGNQVRRVFLDTPYSELAIESRATVETLETKPLILPPFNVRPTIPLAWMPWERHLLQPYLLPPELAETELSELIDYAMGFVKRNDYDLLDTLLDLNATISEEYEHVPSPAAPSASAFDVYGARRGVCQDLANLYICLTQLLGVPARYVCGYLFDPETGGNRGAAPHAWAQVYLPDVGWRGFDPTTGVVTQTDHVRVAVGRSFRDATPTAGTWFVGGGRETLEVAVSVRIAG